MSTDYRRKAKHLRRTSNAAFILAGLVIANAVVFVVAGALWPGLAVLTAAVILIAAGADIRMQARQFARLGASQSRMTAWNRRA
jgi:hypothetical protein